MASVGVVPAQGFAKRLRSAERVSCWDADDYNAGGKRFW